MSNLIREQRFDKNGVLSTKLVRAEAKGKSSRKELPPPFAIDASANSSVNKVQQSYLETLDKKRTHEVGTDDWRNDADASLKELCSATKPSKKLKCTDAEIMDVLTVVREENVLPLLCAGIRSAKQAKKLLRANELDHLLVDNSEQVKNLRYWNMHPRKAVMPQRQRSMKDMYSRSEGYGSLSMRLAG